MRPARAYFHVYPFGRQELSRLAYFFDFDHADGRDPQDYLGAVQAQVAAWKAARMDPMAAPRLDADFDADGVSIRDSRPMARQAVHRLTGLAARLYALCDSTASLAGLAHATGADPAPVEAALAALDNDALVARQGDRVLALAVFRTRPQPIPQESHAHPEPAVA